MKDKLLFRRGHIDVKILGRYYDDFDTSIPDYYFYEVLLKKGVGYDSNGSEFEVIDFDNKTDKFTIEFTCYENEYEELNGNHILWDELVVRCKGAVRQNENEEDYLDIEEYKVINVK